MKLTQIILERFTEGLVWVNPSGRIIKANRVVLNELGYSEEDLPNLKISDINPHFSLLKWKEYWKKLKEEKSITLSTDLITKDHLIFPVDASFYHTRLGSEYCALGLIYSSLKYDRYQRLLEITEKTIRVGGWEWDLVKNEHLFTENTCEILELGRKQFDNYKDDLNAFFALFLKGKPLVRFEEQFKKAIKQGEGFVSKLEIRTPRGNQKWITVNVHPIVVDEKTIRVYGSIQDNTEDKKKEKFLDLAMQSLAKTDSAIAWVNREGKFVYFNEAAKQKLGLEENKPEKRIWQYSLNNSKEKWEKLWNHLAEVKQISGENQYVDSDNEVTPIHYSAFFMEYDKTELVFFIGRDISELKEKEKQIEKALVKIEELNSRLEAENISLKEEVRHNHNNFKTIITNSSKYKNLLRQIEKVAPTNTTVLITGETGTGKELLAKAIYQNSKRKDKPFIAVNCAALPKELIESELFGHEKGAFTGAYKQKVGRFELADGGTIFLDEIGELPFDVQAKLLRVLQDGEFNRVGGEKVVKVDCRIIAATNRNLKKLASEKQFRSDLYYRLNVFPVTNLPLRERKEDIPELAKHFVRKFSKKTGKDIQSIERKSLNRLMSYDYPGNIRELENIIERSVILNKGSKLLVHQNTIIAESPQGSHRPDRDVFAFDEMVRQHIIKALDRTNWKISGAGGAAELLELNPKTLESKMRKLGIHRKRNQTHSNS